MEVGALGWGSTCLRHLDSIGLVSMGRSRGAGVPGDSCVAVAATAPVAAPGAKFAHLLHPFLGGHRGHLLGIGGWPHPFPNSQL